MMNRNIRLRSKSPHGFETSRSRATHTTRRTRNTLIGQFIVKLLLGTKNSFLPSFSSLPNSSVLQQTGQSDGVVQCLHEPDINMSCHLYVRSDLVLIFILFFFEVFREHKWHLFSGNIISVCICRCFYFQSLVRAALSL